jgi:hypothetical protein
VLVPRRRRRSGERRPSTSSAGPRGRGPSWISSSGIARQRCSQHAERYLGRVLHGSRGPRTRDEMPARAAREWDCEDYLSCALPQEANRPFADHATLQHTVEVSNGPLGDYGGSRTMVAAVIVRSCARPGTRSARRHHRAEYFTGVGRAVRRGVHLLGGQTARLTPREHRLRTADRGRSRMYAPGSQPEWRFTHR